MKKLMKAGASCLMAGGIAFVAACSGGSDAERDEFAHDRASAQPSVAATRPASTEKRVCDLIQPFAGDVAAAFGLGFELETEKRSYSMASECYLDMKAASGGTLPEGGKATLLVTRFPAFDGDNVRALAERHENVGTPVPAPSVGPDALLIPIRDGAALALFSHDGRLWGVQSNVHAWHVAGVDEATGAAAAVLRARLGS